MNPISPIVEAQTCMILDGGLATALEYQGACLNDALWSARLLLDDPGAIASAHRQFLVAGADCITTASYQATVEGFSRIGASPRQARKLLQSSVALALQARDQFWSSADHAPRQRPLVAASVGPYGAFLADGSEYSGDYGLDVAALVDFHRERLQVLSDAGPDLLAIETIPSSIEVAALLALLESEPGPPAWVSVCCRDAKHLHDGTAVTEVAARCDSVQRVVAVGVNCTSPHLIVPLIEAVRRGTDKPVVVYPNSGERYEAASHQWQAGDPCLDWMAEAQRWVGAGAKLVGGCCRVGPKAIQALRSQLITTHLLSD